MTFLHHCVFYMYDAGCIWCWQRNASPSEVQSTWWTVLAWLLLLERNGPGRQACCIASFPFPSYEAHLAAGKPSCLQISSSGCPRHNHTMGHSVWYSWAEKLVTRSVGRTQLAPARSVGTSSLGHFALWYESRCSMPRSLCFTLTLEMLVVYKLLCGGHGSKPRYSSLCVLCRTEICG